MKGFWDQDIDLNSLPEIPEEEVVDLIKKVPAHFTDPAGAVPALKYTTGGWYGATIYSGQAAPSLVSCPNAFAVGSDVMLCSGPGRLDSVVVRAGDVGGASGLQLSITFYDAATPVSGGPIPASGHRILGFVPQFQNAISGAQLSGVIPTSYNLPVGAVPFASFFSSGLCVNSRSGQPAFTAFFTPEPQF